MEFLLTLPTTFSHSFSIPQNHTAMGLIPDDKLSDLLENVGLPATCSRDHNTYNSNLETVIITGDRSVPI